MSETTATIIIIISLAVAGLVTWRLWREK